MDASNRFSLEVWGAVALVFVCLLLISILLWKTVGARRARFWLLMIPALALSGTAVRSLVHWWTATPTLRVVPGAVPTWAPAVAMVGTMLLLWRLPRRSEQES